MYVVALCEIEYLLLLYMAGITYLSCLNLASFWYLVPVVGMVIIMRGMFCDFQLYRWN